jgi:hypothetical protein
LGSLKYKLSFSLFRWQSKRGQPTSRLPTGDRFIQKASVQAARRLPTFLIYFPQRKMSCHRRWAGGRATTNKYRAGKTFLTQSINEFIGWLIALRNKSTAIYHDANFCSATMKAN